jgi:hypothetical protein
MASQVVFMDPKRSHVDIIQVIKLLLMCAFTAGVLSATQLGY